MGAQGREYVTANADRQIAVTRYRRLLHDVIG
jgi:hypothetical protein